MPPATAFAAVLGAPEYGCTARFLADGWFDRTLRLRLRGAGVSCPPDICGHLRRSFLGALAIGASPSAQAGAPCAWDPPCALDVFCREQLRGQKGDGLPKPYVIFAEPKGPDLEVSLRVFGMANDWFMRAAEAMSAGITDILPWGRLYPGRLGPPEIIQRHVIIGPVLDCPVPERVVLDFVSPVDASGRDPRKDAWSLLSRMLRRVDGLSRWNGRGLSVEAGIALAHGLRRLDPDVTGLRPGIYQKPNSAGQRRSNRVMQGSIGLRGDLTDFWPALLIAERTHTGRGAVEGLGRFVLRQDG